MSDDLSPARKIVKARTQLVLKQPFFASLAMRLALKEDPSCETAWTDGRTLAYNPAYIEQLPMDELAGLCAHIVMHPACGHHVRRNDRDPMLWNRACDYSINWILLDAGITLPEGFLYHPKYRDKTAEEIYEIISELHHKAAAANNNNNDPSSNGGLGLGNEPGTQNEEEGVSHNETLLPGEDDATDKDAEEQLTDSPPPPSGGDPGKAGEVRDAQAKSNNGETPPDAPDPDWKLSLTQAANYARSIGRLPASVTRVLSELLEPKLDWQDILARFITHTARNDYSWNPPNRRYIHNGLYLPSVQNMEMEALVIVADTSGSISQDDFDFLAAELSAILEIHAVQIYLLYCDLKIQDWQIINRDELPLEIRAKGGGGTDFRPPFQWVEQQGINPACLIYLTDMQCDRFPSQEPNYPVLWASLGGRDASPPFGELLPIQR